MDAWGPLAASAVMGLAGMPHCAAMCGATCSALMNGGGRPIGGRLSLRSGVGLLSGTARSADGASSSTWSFHLARIAGYATAGAIVASSVGAVRSLLSWAPWLHPLWTMLHVAALALGIWMLATARMPAWASGRRTTAPQASGGWQPMRGPVRAGIAGAAWIAWPCGLSQSALLLAALNDGAAGGAASMAAFAIASSPGLALLPLVLQRARGADKGGIGWPIRIAGAALAVASAWALGHGLWQRVAEWCFA